MTDDDAPQQKALFLCTGNSARSQLGEALLRRLAGERFLVYSAGTEPKGVHPLTRRVLDEVGIDTSMHTSKHVREYLGRLTVSHVFIVCDEAAKSCPALYPFARHVHRWPFPDPAAAGGSEEQRLAAFRRVRDAIDARLRAWLAAGAPGEEGDAALARDGGSDGERAP